MPAKGRDLAADNQVANLLLTAMRPPAERANALPKSGFKALRFVTVCPWKIGSIGATALIILTMHRGTRSENPIDA